MLLEQDVVEKKSEGELISDAVYSLSEAVHDGSPGTLSSAVELVAQSLAGESRADTVTASLDRVADAIHSSGWSSMPFDLADRWGSDGLNNIAKAIRDGLSEIADA